MVGVSIAEGTRLSLRLLRRSLRNVCGRLRSHPLLRWGLFLGRTDRLVIAPQDLRTADATRASEIYAGRFAFAGKVVICDGRSPFEITPPSDEWAAELLSFGWLRHLRAAESGITRANARALVDEWIALQGVWHPIAWRPDVMSRRLIAWFSHAPLILHDADDGFSRRFLRSISRQTRALRRLMNDTPDGLPRLEARIALAYAALCLAGQVRRLRQATQLLSAELERQILPDGGHITRNPGVLVEILLDLLPLRQAFAARNVPPPSSLNNAIDRMMPMLRFFRHGDGNFAHFNGMGPTAPDLVATVLRYDDARGAAPASAPHSGYQRLETKNLLVLMDTGTPPPLTLSREAHAGCLSFELSSRQQRIVVNCGLPAIHRETWRQVAALDNSYLRRNDELRVYRLTTPLAAGESREEAEERLGIFAQPRAGFVRQHPAEVQGQRLAAGLAHRVVGRWGRDGGRRFGRRRDGQVAAGRLGRAFWRWLGCAGRGAEDQLLLEKPSPCLGLLVGAGRILAGRRPRQRDLAARAVYRGEVLDLGALRA